MKDLIQSAFLEASQGFSADRVIADPALNRDFIAACHTRGAAVPTPDLNQALLNLRKQGSLKRHSAPKRTQISNTEDFRFAAEIAARHLEQRHQTTLDRVLCDPVLAAELDAVAAELAPHHSSLEYRWVALQLRKSSQLRPEAVLRVAKNQSADFGRVDEIEISALPEEQGIYIFYSASETLYVGEASNLKKRVGKYLDHSDRKALAQWLWAHGISDLRLEILTLPPTFDVLARRAVERELIASRRPVFNIQR